ncbi:MAG TPA: exo-alpha-sialidase [Sulfurivirga caldicuralii]|nr:exo-alpha-sialidase [Sulfurivirga caldicuralii]
MIRTSHQLDFSAAPKTEAPLFLHEAAQWQADLPPGPFVRIEQGIFAIEPSTMQVACYSGQWQRWPLALHDALPVADLALGATCDGHLVMAFMDARQNHFRWLKHLGRASRNSRAPIYISRSEDNGRSWSAPTLIQTGYSGAVRSLVTLPNGRLVLASQYLLPKEGRYVSLTHVSDDGGLSWQASNWLDAGGQGHHDGAIEGYLLPLQDGRLWYLLRTNWDHFWYAFSQDDGTTWTETALGLQASSSPGALLRLEDGRILLAYNPVGDHPPRRGVPFSQRLASWYREKLVLRLSEDDGKSWCDPVTVAYCPGAWLSYPHLFEPTPGRIWLTTMQSGLRLELNVEELFNG